MLVIQLTETIKGGNCETAEPSGIYALGVNDFMINKTDGEQRMTKNKRRPNKRNHFIVFGIAKLRSTEVNATEPFVQLKSNMEN